MLKSNVKLPEPYKKPVRDRILLISIALLSGILMSLAAAPLSFWWLAWIALAPLWVISVRSTVRKTAFPFVFPLAWGIAYHGIALHWITGLHPLMWMGIPWIASVSIVAFAWTFITLWGTFFVCLWAWGMAWLGRLKVAPMVRVLVGTALWCGLETIRQTSALDWTSLSYTQSPYNLAILHLGQIAGPMTVTAAIVAVNGFLAEAWLATDYGTDETDGRSGRFQNLLSTRKSGAKFKPQTSLALFALGSFLVFHLIGFGLYSLPLAQPVETALKVGIVQGNVPTRIKLFSEGLRRAFDGYSAGYRSLADQKVDVVLTSEGAMPFLWEGQNRTQNPVYQALLEKRVPMWLGTFMREGNRYTQSLLTLSPKGETLSRFNKIKLVPLGEYLPFEEILGRLISRLSPIQSFMVPGSPIQRFDTPFGRAAVGICYESAFPELLRSQVASGAGFFITASNLDPYSTVLMAQHQAHDVMRSIETDRWAVRATNTGYSGIVDPHGRIRWQSQPYQYAIHADTIYRRQTQTLYVQWGNWLTPALLGIAAIALVATRRTALRVDR